MLLNRQMFLALSCMLLSLPFAQALTDKYRLIIRDDPSNSIVIGWNQVSGANPIVYFDTIDHGTNTAAYTFTHGVDRTISSRGMDNRYARLSGLLPDKIYYFVIADDNSTSARFSFRTVPNLPSERLSIIAGGDCRTNQLPRQNANIMVAKLRAHAVLFGGDMTEFDSNAEWQAFFDDWQLTIAPDGRMTAIIPTRGNHEYSNTVIEELFDVNNADAYFANTFGGNLFRAYTLNSNIATGGVQATWLQTDLQASNNIIWKAAQYHHPMRPHTTVKPERNDIYTDWLPLFEQYGMNFAIECDAHVVKHTYPVKASTGLGSDEGFIRDDLNGIVYIGEGCWGAPLRAADDRKDWTRDMGAFNQFHLLYIEINKVEMRAVLVDNASTVGQLDDNTRFNLPANIDIWQAPTGDVIVLENYRLPGRPNVSLVNPLQGQSFVNYSTIPLIALASDTDGGTVDSVQFFVNGEYVGTAVSGNMTFRVNWTPTENGVYGITAKAFDNDGKMNRTSNVWVTVYTNNNVFASTVLQGSDDAEEYSNGTLVTNSSTLNLADDQSGGQNGQNIGIRFANLGIPQGAIIQNAYIQFTSSGASTGPCNLTIKIQDDAGGLAFSGTGNISGRLALGTTVAWSPPDWTVGALLGPDQRTPNLAALLQQIVNKPTWTAGNAAVFLISGSGERIASSSEGGNAPQLIVEYSLTGNNYPGNLQVQIDNSSDDAEESILGTTNTTDTDLDIVFELGNQKIGLRFNDITIPRGAIIESAYIQFHAIDVNSGTTNFSIRVQDDVNPLPFDALSLSNISARPTMATTVTWNPAGWGSIGEADAEQRSANIAPLLQDLINKPDWVSGNAAVFIITGSGERDAVAYDGDSTQAPILVVNYRQSFPPIQHNPLPDMVICGNATLTANAGSGYSQYYWNEDTSANQSAYLSISNPGIYTLRVRDTFGQVAYDTFVVTQSPLAQPNLGPDVIYQGSPVTLTVNGGPFVSYHWNNGATTQSITVNAVGGYSVTATNSGGCSGSDVVIVYQPIAVNYTASLNMDLYPNPCVDILNIKLSQAASEQINLQIVDMQGRVVFAKELPAGQALWPLDTEGLAAGNYWLRLAQHEKQIAIKQFVKR